MRVRYINVALSLLMGFFVGRSVLAETAGPVQAAFDALDNFSKTVGIFSPKVGVQTLAGKLVLQIFGIIGSLALVIFIYGGIIWMTAGAEPKKVNIAKKTMLWAVLGLAAIFLSYIVVKMIIEVVSK